MAGTAQLTQSAIEIIAIPAAVGAQLTQSAIELVTINNPKAQLTQSSIEIITLPAPTPPHGPQGPGGPGTGGGPNPGGPGPGGPGGPGPGGPGGPGPDGPGGPGPNLGPSTYPPGLVPVNPIHPPPFPFVRCCVKNEYDACLEAQADKERRIRFPQPCTLPEGLKNRMPWGDMEDGGALPAQSKPWLTSAGILTPGPADGDQIVCTSRVPLGYDALFSGVFLEYSGGGYLPGSGDIVWRVLVNIHYPNDLGNMQYLMGSAASPLPLVEGQIVYSGSVISLIVAVPNLSGNIQVGASRMFGGIMGFLWPRG